MTLWITKNELHDYHSIKHLKSYLIKARRKQIIINFFLFFDVVSCIPRVQWVYQFENYGNRSRRKANFYFMIIFLGFLLFLIFNLICIFMISSFFIFKKKKNLIQKVLFSIKLSFFFFFSACFICFVHSKYLFNNQWASSYLKNNIL
jgi:hypothetical protein